MSEHGKDLRGCLTAFECRDQLPGLSDWMSEQALKQVPIWQGTRFQNGEMYFDLDNPERGPFVATGDEHPPTHHAYVQRADVPERIWARLVTWKRPVSRDEASALEMNTNDLGIGIEHSAAGQARPLPRD